MAIDAGKGEKKKLGVQEIRMSDKSCTMRNSNVVVSPYWKSIETVDFLLDNLDATDGVRNPIRKTVGFPETIISEVELSATTPHVNAFKVQSRNAADDYSVNWVAISGKDDEPGYISRAKTWDEERAHDPKVATPGLGGSKIIVASSKWIRPGAAAAGIGGGAGFVELVAPDGKVWSKNKQKGYHVNCLAVAPGNFQIKGGPRVGEWIQAGRERKHRYGLEIRFAPQFTATPIVVLSPRTIGAGVSISSISSISSIQKPDTIVYVDKERCIVWSQNLSYWVNWIAVGPQPQPVK